MDKIIATPKTLKKVGEIKTKHHRPHFTLCEIMDNGRSGGQLQFHTYNRRHPEKKDLLSCYDCNKFKGCKVKDTAIIDKWKCFTFKD